MALLNHDMCSSGFRQYQKGSKSKWEGSSFKTHLYNFYFFSILHDFGVWFQAVAAEAGTVEIYNLKSEFADLPKKEFEELNNTFTRYIALL